MVSTFAELLPAHPREVNDVPTALVTGSPDRVADVAIALKSQGYDILSAGSGVPSVPGGLPPGSVDCYVQLPGGAVSSDAGDVRRPRSLVASELLARFDTTAEVAPLLAPRAMVVLVTDTPPQRPRPLVGLLAEAILADHGRDGVRAKVLQGHLDPTEIATAANTPKRAEGRDLAALEPEMGYTDWRDEIFCLMSSD